MEAPITWIVVVTVAAGFVQSLTGFGFGLVAMSLWAWVLDPRSAHVLAVFGALTGQILASFTVPRDFDWSLVGPFVAGGLVGLPLGLALLSHLDTVRFRADVGALLAADAIRTGAKWAEGAFEKREIRINVLMCGVTPWLALDNDKDDMPALETLTQPRQADA